eukprot:958622-Prorocentrum_minimum.AAC.3
MRWLNKVLMVNSTVSVSRPTWVASVHGGPAERKEATLVRFSSQAYAHRTLFQLGCYIGLSLLVTTREDSRTETRLSYRFFVSTRSIRIAPSFDWGDTSTNGLDGCVAISTLENPRVD